MNSMNNVTGGASGNERRRDAQREQLRTREADLGRLVSQGNKEEFFKQVIPLLRPLKDYIRRRLKIAYLSLELRTEAAFTSGDILDEVVLSAYENYDKKPKDLSLEEWLYQLANQKLENRLKRASKRDARRRSLESLTEKEERTLEERMTADAEGEVMLVDDLYDTEYHLQPEFTPPAYRSDPSEVVEREEEFQQALRALARIQERERIIFELSAVEGFSNEEVAKIVGVSPEIVPHVVEQVKGELRRMLQNGSRNAA